MKIEIKTLQAQDLLAKIKKDIKENVLKTWATLEIEGVTYFTHSPDQWNKKVLLKPLITANPGQLEIHVMWYKSSEPEEYTKGFYIGRFTEVLLEHYRDWWSKLETYS